MMKFNTIRKYVPAFFTTAWLLIAVAAYAQDDIEMADALRANGKIYVVVGVLSIIFIGLIIYLIRLDRKISRMEKNKKQNT